VAHTTISDNDLNCPNNAITATVGTGTYDVTISDNIIASGGGVLLEPFDASVATFYVNGNQFSALQSAPVAVTATGTATVCLQLNDNTAYPTAGAYVLRNLGTGTFTLNPPTGNIGQVTEPTGTITPGTCP